MEFHKVCLKLFGVSRGSMGDSFPGLAINYGRGVQRVTGGGLELCSNVFISVVTFVTSPNFPVTTGGGAALGVILSVGLSKEFV